jgi:hypothetical protein
MNKTETKCVMCQRKFKRVPSEVNAFDSIKCQDAFIKLVGLSEETQFKKAETGRCPHLVILGKHRIVRVELKNKR